MSFQLVVTVCDVCCWDWVCFDCWNSSNLNEKIHCKSNENTEFNLPAAAVAAGPVEVVWAAVEYDVQQL